MSTTLPSLADLGRKVRIGTRGSPLALYQARLVASGLAAHLGGTAEETTEIVVIRTTGDKEQGRLLSEIGGKGLFTKEIEEGLIDGSLDCAVHSMKDMPTELPAGLVIAGLLPRETPADSLIARDGLHLDALPEGAVIGTASLRRRAQILAHRPDLKAVPLRGNVETRLRKLADGQVDATLLAEAGLRRLERDDVTRQVLETSIVLPAVAQGAIGIEVREDRPEAMALASALDDAATRIEVAAERALLRVLDGSCRTPIGGLARVVGDGLVLEGLLALPDGSKVFKDRIEGAATEAERLGTALGERLLETAGDGFRAEMDRLS